VCPTLDCGRVTSKQEIGCRLVTFGRAAYQSLRGVGSFVAHGLFGFSRAVILPVKRLFERISPSLELAAARSS